jgi:hypothetical protein
MVAHWRKRDFSWNELFVKGVTKLFISLMAMICFNAIASIEGIPSEVKVYILLVGKMMNLFYILGSAFNNMFYITGGQMPPKVWMLRMKEFNKTLEPKSLLNTAKNETNTTE